jgi:DNA polymerase-3 subunit beta
MEECGRGILLGVNFPTLGYARAQGSCEVSKPQEKTIAKQPTNHTNKNMTATKTRSKKNTIATEFSVEARELQSAIDIIAPAVPSRPSHPILANILIATKAGEMALTGFNLSLGIKHTIAITEGIERSFCVSLGLLKDIVSKLEGAIGFAFEENQVVIVGKSGTYKLGTFASEEFPEFPEVEIEGSAPIQLPTKIFLDGLKQTMFAASTEESKQMLCGVKITAADGAIEFAGTNGHYLSVASSEFLDAFECILPVDAAKPLMKHSDETFLLKVDRGLAEFQMGNTIVTTRLLEGQYPDYQRLIPTQFATKWTIDRAAFIQSLERIAVLADQSRSIIVLDCNESELSISCDVADIGSGVETIEVEVDGLPIKLAFNVKYLLQGLRAMKGDRVLMQLNAPTSPVVITPIGEGMTFLIMPVQIRI